MFRVLGEVRVDDASNGDVELSDQLRRLVGILIAGRGEAVPAALIIDRLWEGDPPKTAAKVVYVIMGRLRRALEPDLAPAEPSSFVITSSTGYRLEAGDTDLDRYEFLVGRAYETADSAPGSAISYLDDAIALWGRPWGSQADEGWLAPTVAGLEERHLRVEEMWGDLALNRGRRSDIIERLQGAAAREPLRERRWAHLILALYRAGRQAEALRTYDKARKLLRDELGIEPGRDLQQLHLALLEQDASLELHATEPPSTASVTSFVGRHEELAQLARDLERHRLITVVGIGGIGKTRLVEEFAHRLRLDGQTVRIVTFATVTDDHRFAEHLARGLGLDIDAETAESTLAVVASVLRRDPTVLVLDAVENVAAEAAHGVLALVSRCPQLRILATSRVPLSISGERLLAPDPLPIGSPSQVRGTALELLLDRAGLSDRSITATEFARLEARCRATGGVPLLVELAAATTADGGDVPINVASDHDFAVHQAIQHAMSSVDEQACQLLEEAAVLPDGITEETASLLRGWSANTARRATRQLAWVHLVGTRAGLAALRYRSLDPIREALLGTMSDQDWKDAVERASAAVGHVLRSVRPEEPRPYDATRLDAAEDEHANLQFLLSTQLELRPADALELAIAASAYWPSRGHAAYGEKWIETIVSAAAPEGLLSWRATVATARVKRTFGEIAEFQPKLEQAIHEMHEAGERSWILENGCVFVAIARGWRGDQAGAQRAIVEAKSLNDEFGSEWAWERADKISALGMAFSGDFIGARALQRRHATRLIELEDPISASMSWYLSAALGDLAGRDDIMIDIQRSRELATDTRDLSLLQRLLLLEARVLRRAGNDRSRALLTHAADRLFELGGVRAAALARRDLGIFAIERGELAEAKEQLQFALPLLLQLDRPAAAVAAGGLAAIAQRGGDDVTARRLAEAALALRTTKTPSSVHDGALLESLTADIDITASEIVIDDAQILEIAGAT